MDREATAEALTGAEPAPLARLEYRPDVDGLRAVAVLAVVAYHAAPGALPGGFVGVDVFFVISGFLISGIILRALAQGTFSLADFYARRVRRIFPALIVVLASVWIFGWLMLLPEEYRQLGKHIAAGSGFALNLVQFAQSGRYFGTIESEPLIHLWSLGVEEQFYLLWPLLLLALWRWRVGLLALILLVAAISFAANISTVVQQPLAAFYLPTSRLWELAMGGALAYWQLQRGERLSSKTSVMVANAMSCIGLFLLLIAFVKLNSRMTFPGWWALLPSLGALLVLSAGARSWINRRVLSMPALVFIGLISYPLYLWHWPLLAFADILGKRDVSIGLTAAAVAAAFVLAYLTYKYVEAPLRFSSDTKRVVGGLCTAMVLCACVGYLSLVQGLPPRSQSYGVGQFTQWTTEDWLPGTDVPWTRFMDGFPTVGNGTKGVLFIGDSNMQQYYRRIERVVADHPSSARRAVFAVRGGCAPPAAMMAVDRAACTNHLAQAMSYANDPSIDTVVIGACWYCHLVAFGPWKDFGTQRPLKPGVDLALNELRQMISGFVTQGKRVYVVVNIPIGHSFDPRHMIRRRLFAPAFSVEIPAPSRNEIMQVVGPIVSRVASVARSEGATVIDPILALCDGATCPAVTSDGEPMYRDFAHLRPSYVRDHVRFLDETVLDGSTVAGRAEAACSSTFGCGL